LENQIIICSSIISCDADKLVGYIASSNSTKICFDDDFFNTQFYSLEMP